MARAFLEYMATNGGRMKDTLRRSVTYVAGVFEDSWQEAIISVYNTLDTGGTVVESFERYFYRAATYEYARALKRHNRARDRRDQGDPEDDGHGFSLHQMGEARREEEKDRAVRRAERIRAMLTEAYGEAEAELFMAYYREKAEKGRAVSYRSFSRSKGIPRHHIERLLGRMTRYIRQKKINF